MELKSHDINNQNLQSNICMQISMKMHIANCSQASALVTAILQGDASLLGAALCKPHKNLY